MDIRFRGIQYILLANLILGCPFAYAKTASTPVSIQAALIKNFTHLIEWPKSHLWDSQSTFNLCIYKSNSVVLEFKNIFMEKVVKGKEAHIININSPDLSSCDLVYIGPSLDDAIVPILKEASKLGVLTVSSSSGYGKQGVHINFFEEGNNVAFELNKHALDSAGFQVSTQLFRYAKIVQ